MAELAVPPGTKGILRLCALPDAEWSDFWNRIVVRSGIKDRLLNYGSFVLTQREGRSRVGLPLHGLLILQGVPGTGKTSLARGLANEIATVLSARNMDTLFVEVSPHSFPSELLGESQRGLERLFLRTLPDLAKQTAALIVLFDEVETVAVSRSRTSLETNPIDVHRSTDAVLTGLDELTRQHPNTLVLATSNLPEIVDEGLVSRADIVENIELPGPEAARVILMDSMRELGAECSDVSHDQDLTEVVELAMGLDARKLRKLVLEGVISKRELILEPERVCWGDLVTVLRERREEKSRRFDVDSGSGVGRTAHSLGP
jgi:pachytene checkpoint protein 2